MSGSEERMILNNFLPKLQARKISNYTSLYKESLSLQKCES